MLQFEKKMRRKISTGLTYAIFFENIESIC